MIEQLWQSNSLLTRLPFPWHQCASVWNCEVGRTQHLIGGKSRGKMGRLSTEKVQRTPKKQLALNGLRDPTKAEMMDEWMGK